MIFDNPQITVIFAAISSCSLIANIFFLFNGATTGVTGLLLIGLLIVNIFLFPILRWFSEVRGLYTGRKRFVASRTNVARFLAFASVLTIIGSRLYEWDTIYALSTMNIFFSYVLANCFIYGKVRGRFYWYRFI
jgi:hypothetical protein